MPTTRSAFGITYYSLSLHDIRTTRSLFDLPRAWWPILLRSGNYEPRNRIDHRDGAWPQLGAVDHIGAGWEDRDGLDTGAELLTEYGLNPANLRASWNVAGDSDTVCLLAPGDVRPWQHGVEGSPFDLNSYGIGYEDGIRSPDWRLLPADKREAHYRMRAAWWALVVGTLGWPLKYTATPEGVWDHIRRGESWGFTQHGIVDPRNRSDAGLVWEGGRRINTFDYDVLFRKIREEQKIRAGGSVSTPGLPSSRPEVTRLQSVLNELGHNLDLDGSFGDLTSTAARETADDTGYTGDLSDVAALTRHLEDSVSKIMQALDGLAQKVIGSPIDPMAHTREALNIPEGQTRTLGWFVDVAARNAVAGKRYALAALNVAKANADRTAGLEAAVLAIAGKVEGVDADDVARQIAERVGTYQLELRKVDAQLEETAASEEVA